jgi:hypothetical protein
MTWITYKVQAQSGTTFTHFSRLTNLEEAKREWEEKFRQKAKTIALDDNKEEFDFSDLFSS